MTFLPYSPHGTFQHHESQTIGRDRLSLYWLDFFMSYDLSVCPFRVYLPKRSQVWTWEEPSISLISELGGAPSTCIFSNEDQHTWRSLGADVLQEANTYQNADFSTLPGLTVASSHPSAQVDENGETGLQSQEAETRGLQVKSCLDNLVTASLKMENKNTFRWQSPWLVCMEPQFQFPILQKKEEINLFYECIDMGFEISS